MYNVEKIVFDSWNDVCEVITEMKSVAETYGVVRVADYYDICDHDSSYDDTKYGWLESTIKNVHVCRVRDGYIVNLPEPVCVAIPSSLSCSSKPTYRPYNNPSSKPTPKPLTIAVDSNVDDLDGVLATVFKYVYTITDREVQIDIT